MGEDVEGKVGDEEAGYVGYAGVDPGMETEGAWQGVEEVAEWEGEIGLLLRLWVKEYVLGEWVGRMDYVYKDLLLPWGLKRNLYWRHERQY